MKPQTPPCEHVWKLYKQTVQSDNPKFDRHAYFVVKACDKCKIKKYIDYKVTI